MTIIGRSKKKVERQVKRRRKFNNKWYVLYDVYGKRDTFLIEDTIDALRREDGLKVRQVKLKDRVAIYVEERKSKKKKKRSKKKRKWFSWW